MACRSGKRKEYDDQALAFALARQLKPGNEIARDFGLTPSYVYKIRSGKNRPEIQPLIQAIRRGLDEGLEEWACQWVRDVLSAHIRAGLGDGRVVTARKCRHYLLERFLPNEDGTWPVRHSSTKRR